MKKLLPTALFLAAYFTLISQSGIYFAGVGAGASNTTGDNNTFIGYFAGNSNTSGNDNSFLGTDSGSSNTIGNGNSFFGKKSGMNNTTGSQNVFFGVYAGQQNTIGISNSFVGFGAGFSNTDGTQNVFLGTNSGSSNINGNGNVFLGPSSGLSNTFGFYNTFVGVLSGQGNETGFSNCFLGRRAGINNSSGAFNIAIGEGAGPTNANDNQSHRLYIDVSNSSGGNDDPLIYGEFDNDFVKINGTFEVTAGLSNPSSRAIKNHFTTIDAAEILTKLASMNIQQWTYKHRTNEKHIGPVAEEFYELFELGAGNTKISTIDADGVMMLSIQALKEKNDRLENEMEELKVLVESLLAKTEKK